MINKNSRTVLYLLGKKGMAVLNGLVNTGHSESILAVVVATDKAMAEDYSKEIIQVANKNEINVYSRNDSLVKEQASKFAVAIGWRWIIDPVKHEMLFVLHDSLLPRFRGFAPLVSQLLKGEPKIGVTAVIATEEYDKGDIVGQESVNIEYPLKVAEAIERILPLYEVLAVRIFTSILKEQEIVGFTQDEEKATYSAWRDDLDLKINWNHSSAEIRRFVDSTGFPFQGAFAILDGKRVVFEEVEEVEELKMEFRHVGKTIRFQDGCPVIICGSGLLLIRSAAWFRTGDKIVDWPRFRMRLD